MKRGIARILLAITFAFISLSANAQQPTVGLICNLNGDSEAAFKRLHDAGFNIMESRDCREIQGSFGKIRC